MTVEGTLKYMPNILVRRRYIGDTQAPMATRTTGINASARSLIYANYILLSTLVNNNQKDAGRSAAASQASRSYHHHRSGR